MDKDKSGWDVSILCMFNEAMSRSVASKVKIQSKGGCRPCHGDKARVACVAELCAEAAEERDRADSKVPASAPESESVWVTWTHKLRYKEPLLRSRWPCCRAGRV